VVPLRHGRRFGLTGLGHRDPQQQEGGERAAGQKDKCGGEPGLVDYNREHGENARSGERRNEPENGTGRQKPASKPCCDRGKGVTGVVERIVSADPSREQRGADNS
jgi:hypothetical protein